MATIRQLTVDGIRSIAKSMHLLQPMFQLKYDVPRFDSEKLPAWDNSMYISDDESLQFSRLEYPKQWGDLEWDPTIAF
jgi:hypothetical protein